MKTTAKITILTLLAVIATLGIIATPGDDSQNWMLALLTGKATGAAAAWLTVKCYRSWSKSDKLIKKYNSWCNVM